MVLFASVLRVGCAINSAYFSSRHAHDRLAFSPFAGGIGSVAFFSGWAVRPRSTKINFIRLCSM